ncbi:electron transfer flavoprotein subunit beta/FixA family protein [Desulfurispora thermophila]|uniref:electron transfer flavoprotein subunit beta/FixA family protein n=1 Tax=Desulfurispora thermophila TaxID=265470 RepID=UPI000364F854|nr:electron transfer flavoprotein subunit beta/FixA family protein [Desulfurispora thermophila]
MTMHIVVCMKAVPDPAHWSQIEIDEEKGILKRQECPLVINPLDRHALELALQIKEKTPATISVVSMGPYPVQSNLQQFLALGADQAYLLSDYNFAGADTLATARTLAAAIQQYMSPYSYILCGAWSLDGNTAQVGPQLATLLDIPHITEARQITIGQDGMLIIETKYDYYCNTYHVDCPVLITVTAEINKPRSASLMGILAARNKQCTVLDAAALNLPREQIGLAGSPTRPHRLFTPHYERRQQYLSGSLQEAASALTSRLQSEGWLKR